MGRMAFLYCVKLGKVAREILALFHVALCNILRWPIYPDRSACSVRYKTGEHGCWCPTDVLYRNVGSLRQVGSRLTQSGETAKG